MGYDGSYHPPIHNERCRQAVYSVQLALAELYQAIDELDEDVGK